MEALQRLVEWDRWANGVMLEFCMAHAVPEAARGLLHHIIGAELLWLARIDGAALGEVWPDYTAEEAERALETAGRRWRQLLDSDPDLARDIEYTNSRGERFTSPLGDIVLHVVTHSAYHRGQMNSRIREVGLTPPYVDFIHASRQNLLGAEERAAEEA